ncbi:MAG TPA: MBL fold metallo-hydrolase [Anaerolineaceae bacterium]|nr:MBL fold metallo-hydrolase [Anaerolineaceae bacterium]
MKIHFNGAAQTVTGSQHLLEINGKKILLECGIYQGRRKDFYSRNCCFSFDPGSVDALILSHAHIDHSGNLPNLVKQGYAGPIYATPPTCELADIMLQDSGHIYEEDAEYLNKKKRRRGEELIEPLYTKEDARQVKQYFQPVGYNQVFEPIPGVQARLLDAGHILGSAGVCLDIEEHGKTTRLWFSGDIGRPGLSLIRDPQLPQKVNYLIMECTYGDKAHSDPEEAFVELRDVVLRTVQRRGKIIIPAFSVGRTQEIVYNLNRMISAGDLPRIPVFVDSPLAINATEIFRHHPEYFDDETHTFMETGNHPALTFDGLEYTRSVEESKAINYQPGPQVIIAASGMAEAGRILHHLKNNIEDERNTIVIVSWQAPYTLGRRIADREPKVRIFGEEYNLRAEVATIGGFSSHAGQNFLLDYAQSTQSSLQGLFLVHGDPDAATAFQQVLAEHHFSIVHYPQMGESVEI